MKQLVIEFGLCSVPHYMAEKSLGVSNQLIVNFFHTNKSIMCSPMHSKQIHGFHMHILLFVFILRTKRNNIVVRCCSCHIWSHFFCHFVSTLVVKSIILCCSVYFRPIFRLFYAFWEIFIPSNVIFELNSAQVKGMHHITGQWIRHISSSLANGDYGFQIVVVFRTFDRIHLPFSFYLFSLLIFQILILHSVSTMC